MLWVVLRRQEGVVDRDAVPDGRLLRHDRRQHDRRGRGHEGETPLLMVVYSSIMALSWRVAPGWATARCRGQWRAWYSPACRKGREGHTGTFALQPNRTIRP